MRPLPESALRIARMTTDDRFSAHELAALIASDPAITARLLRLANSAYYGFPRRIGTVRDAVVLVGLRAVRSVVLVACVMDAPAVAPSRSGIDARATWRFAVSVGVIAELLARDAQMETDAAFTAGVLHNVGLSALDQYRPQQLRAVMRLVRSGKHTLHDAERDVLGFTDPELGGALAARWDFPPELATAIRDHARSLNELPEPRSLAACVLRARLIARSLGLPDGLGERTAAASVHPGAGAQAVTGERLDGPGRIDDPEGRIPLSVSEEIDRGGGVAGILRRADAFVNATVV